MKPGKFRNGNKSWLGIYVNKIAVFLLLGICLLFGEHFNDRFLFRLGADQPHLILRNQNKNGLPPYMQHLVKKYPVARIERWLKSAGVTDVRGKMDFSKIYRVILTGHQSNSRLQQIIGDFNGQPEIQTAHPEPANRMAMPVEPYLSNDPYLDRQWYLQKIQAP